MLTGVVTCDSQGRQRFTCTAVERHCRGEVAFPDGAEECVTLDGRLFDGNGIGQVLFRKTDRVCTSPTGEPRGTPNWLQVTSPDGSAHVGDILAKVKKKV